MTATDRIHVATLHQLARAILACLDKVEKIDPSVGIYYEDGKPTKGNRKP